MLPRTRTDVDDPVGGADGVLVVLDDDERVAQVLEANERLDEPVVVALVQADRRLVEDVQHADEPGADLRGETDALRLTAGERPGRAVEAEVVEADVEEEAKPLVDLLEHPLADLALAVRHLQAAQVVGGIPDAEGADLGDVLGSGLGVVEQDGADDRLQPGPLALGTRHLAHETLRAAPD